MGIGNTNNFIYLGPQLNKNKTPKSLLKSFLILTLLGFITFLIFMCFEYFALAFVIITLLCYLGCYLLLVLIYMFVKSFQSTKKKMYAIFAIPFSICMLLFCTYMGIIRTLDIPQAVCQKYSVISGYVNDISNIPGSRSSTSYIDVCNSKGTQEITFKFIFLPNLNLYDKCTIYYLKHSKTVVKIEY